CLRVLRGARCDVLVVRPGEGGRRVVVAIDGSHGSWRALEQALGVGRALGLGVEVVAAFDPVFHRVAFQALAGVLSDEAGRLFRFREQEKLHDQVIDQGLMKLYQGYLVQASHLAEQQGQRVSTRLLEGKAWAAILSLLEGDPPQMLVVGRYGSHRNGHDIGSTAEELARQAPCSVLVTTGESPSSLSEPEAAQAPGQVEWTAEAEARLGRVPFFARGMARKAIEDYARENGIAQITPEVMARAREHRGL
ncbi:MAG: universal stress protein, partial [Chloroflexota bacterium]